MGLKGWSIEGDRLVREYKFNDFIQAMVFLNKAINPIEEWQNYPRIIIAYNRVKIALFTTEAGAVTTLDFEMAQAFDQLARDTGSPPP